MEFQLVQAQKEAERRVIEAKGIADSRKVITAGLTSDLLRWKGLEVTEKLAASPNTKVIVIGNPGMGGLPIILGDVK
jgi:regulator of protease activity HflC (stomatin/prohibitin superfamily)